jgi:hypothetical protein
VVCSGIKGGFSGSNNNGPASWNADTRWIASLAGRLGFAIDNVLFTAAGTAEFLQGLQSAFDAMCASVASL